MDIGTGRSRYGIHINTTLYNILQIRSHHKAHNVYGVIYEVWYSYRSGWPPLLVQTVHTAHIYDPTNCSNLLTLHKFTLHPMYILCTLHFPQCTHCVHYFILLTHTIICILTTRLHFLYTLLHHAHSLHANPLNGYIHYSTTQWYPTHTYIQTPRKQNGVYHIYMEYSVLVAPVFTECIALLVWFCVVLHCIVLYRIMTDDGTGT